MCFCYLTVLLIDFSHIELLQCHLMRWSYGVFWITVYIFKPLTFFHIYLILSVIQEEKKQCLFLMPSLTNC